MRSVHSITLVIYTCFTLLMTGALGQNAQQAKPPEPDLINPDRPGIADGSTVIGPRHYQIETGYQNEYRNDKGSTEHRDFFPTLLRFGINSTWEARVETLSGFTQTRAFDPASGIHSTEGYSPISLGVKYHWQDMAGASRPSLGTIMRVFVPSGSSDFGSHRTQADLRLAVDQNLTADGTWEVNPNIGVGLYDNGTSGLFVAGLFAMTLNYFNRDKTLNPFVDMGVQAPELVHGRTSTIVDAGVAWIVTPNVQLDVSAGTGILGRTPPHPFWAFGVSLRR